MASSNRQVTDRDIDEAVRQAEQAATRQAVTEGIQAQEILDNVTAELNAQADEADRKGDDTDERIAALESQLARQLDLQEKQQRLLEETAALVQQQAALGVNGMAESAKDAQLEKLRLMKIQGIMERGGTATIVIHPNPSNPKENWPVPLGINGQRVDVKRGVPTRVPVEFLGCLEEARVETVEPRVINGQVVPTAVNIHSYPYNIVDVQPGPSLMKTPRPKLAA